MARRSRSPAEIELKFDLDEPAANVIEHHPLLAATDPQTRSQCSIYFETPKGKLGKWGYSLRVRQIGDCFTQTLKTRQSHAGLFDRGEWETPVAAMQPEPEALIRTPLRKLKKNTCFIPVVRSVVERSSWLVEHLDSTVEVCLDRGEVVAAGGKQRFQELELELKRGDPADLFSFARTILEAATLKLGVLSKDERGELLGQEPGDQAPTPMIDARMTVGQVFEQIVECCVRHFRLNEAPILADWDEAALHQARIAMRRLRGALDFFRPAIRQSGLSALETEVRWLAGSLADARDIDVFMAQHDYLCRADRNKLRAARKAAYTRAIAAVDSPRLRSLLLDLVQWLAVGEWQKKTAGRSISKFASRRLDNRWNTVRQRASNLAELDDNGLHRLRIAVKKLRYAVDFLGPLYGKRARKIESRLGKIQDCLGLLNDEAVGRKLIADLSLRIADRCPAERAKRLDLLEKHFHKLAEAGRFW